jgi:hypothetical protein
MTDRALFRWGSWAAITGAVVALVFNLLHPRIDEFGDVVVSELQAVADSDAWIPIHLGILLGTLLITFALFVLARSMKGGPAEGMARVALGALLISAPVGIVTLGVDGYAMKEVADGLAGGGDPAAGATMVHIGWSLFMAFTITFIGITPALFGLAVVADPGYPSGLGWGAALVGLVVAVDGVVGTLAGPSSAFFIVFTVGSGLLTVWILVLGVLLGRRATATARV